MQRVGHKTGVLLRDCKESNKLFRTLTSDLEARRSWRSQLWNSGLGLALSLFQLDVSLKLAAPVFSWILAERGRVVLFFCSSWLTVLHCYITCSRLPTFQDSISISLEDSCLCLYFTIILLSKFLLWKKSFQMCRSKGCEWIIGLGFLNTHTHTQTHLVGCPTSHWSEIVIMECQNTFYEIPETCLSFLYFSFPHVDSSLPPPHFCLRAAFFCSARYMHITLLSMSLCS